VEEEDLRGSWLTQVHLEKLALNGNGRRRSLLKCSSQRLDWYNKIKHTKHTIR